MAPGPARKRARAAAPPSDAAAAPARARGAGRGDPLAALAGLPEAEKRRRLLELLADDGASGSEPAEDAAWTLPKLTPERRTADAGESMRFGFQECDLSLGAGGATAEEAAPALEHLRKSCRLVHALDGSSWMPCRAEPRCLAERLAAAVFAHHTEGCSFDPARSGAEWWAQVRQGGHREERIQFHWDTDECAVEQHGVNIHPHLSTITYLTDCGAPTLVVECRNSHEAGAVETVYGPIARGLLSHPRVGKHVAFDGQLLHGTVPLPAAQGVRVTFLVNVWLDHRPSGCFPLPEELARRLGGLGPGPARVALSPGRAPRVIRCDPGRNVLQTCFSRRELFFSKLVAALPLVRDSAVLEWPGAGARLCRAEGPLPVARMRTKAASPEEEGQYPPAGEGS